MTSGQGRLAGKTAIVTGAAGDIGAATARLFLAEGAAVALLDRDATGLERIRAALPEIQQDRCFLLPCDIATGAVQAVEAAVAKLGGLDVLVNNAAVREYNRLGDADDESWARIISVNLLGTSACTRTALPMLRRGGKGTIVNVASAFALVGRSGMGQYDATKAAIVAMTKVLANEEARHGIRANVVCPGSVLTSYTLGRAAMRGLSEAELVAKAYVACPLDRWGKPEEVAAPILFLASDEASFITGAVLAVDGGLAAR